VAVGYRFGSFMPYAILSEFKITESDRSAIPPKATSLALGGRYDIGSNFALKAEWARYKNNSLYAFTDASSPDVAGKKINVMTVALDFVF